MKQEWHTKTIGEVCEVVNGGTPKTGVKEYWDGSFRWITPAEMGKRQNPYVSETERTLTEKGMGNSSAKLLPNKCVILSSRAPIGHLVINTQPMAFNQGCKGLIPSEGLYYKFLFHYLTSKVDLLNSLGTGATFKELSGGKLKEVPIPVPPLPEQQRIVSILDEAFEGIATASANAEKNLSNARELFHGQLEAIFADPHCKWKEQTIDQVCKKVTDGEHLRPTVTKSGVPFLSAKDVQVHDVIFDDPLYVSEEDAVKFRKRCNPERGDILIVSRGATVGRSCVVKSEKLFCLLGSVILLKVNEGTSAEYVSYALKSPTVSKGLMTISEAAAQQAIYLRDIKPLKIRFPSFQEQIDIVARLSELAAVVKALETTYHRKLLALSELKKSILHQAFTGQLH